LVQCGSAVISSIFNQCGSGSGSGCGTVSRSGILKTKNKRKKLQLDKKCNLIINDLHEGRQSYRRSLHPALQKIKFLHFFLVIFALLDPDPADQKECESMRIRICNTA
jgi:hypothetical protein